MAKKTNSGANNTKRYNRSNSKGKQSGKSSKAKDDDYGQKLGKDKAASKFEEKTGRIKDPESYINRVQDL